MQRIIATIPFSGFYESIHDSEIDRALESEFSDHETGCTINDALLHRAWDAVNFSAVRHDYAKEYAAQFAHNFGLKTLEFESMQSPKEYNFTTDRIFCFIDYAELCRIIGGFNLSEFADHVKEKFTSRDGFASFYSPVLAEWGNVKTWDHNQAGTALEFYAMQESGGEFDQWAEFDVIEPALCNGFLFESLHNNGSPEFFRLCKIHDYLQNRAA